MGRELLRQYLRLGAQVVNSVVNSGVSVYELGPSREFCKCWRQDLRLGTQDVNFFS